MTVAEIKAFVKQISDISEPKELRKVVKEQDLDFLKDVKKHLDNLYYNTNKPTVEDWQYDVIKKYLMTKDAYKYEVGAPVKSRKAKLAFWLGSLVFYTDADDISRWKKNNKASSYVISDKLDGISCLLTCDDGNIRMFTRGDGIIGQDISHIVPYIKLPKLKQSINVRGELIIKKKVFQKYKDDKTYRSSRNMVFGLINTKKPSPEDIKNIDFVTYEIIGDSMPKQETNLKQLESMKFNVVNYHVKKDFDFDSLSSMFIERREHGEYEMDGLVVQTNLSYDRNINGDPDYAFAFKMVITDNINTTTVESVEWNVSKWSVLKPVVLVKPVDLGNSTISRVSAHNAKYIVDNNIGPGTKLKVIRSNDVIPYIYEVVKGTKAQMPDVEYEWDKNKVNIVSVTSTSCIKFLSTFFSAMNIKFVSDETIKKLVNAGYDTLLKIVEMSEDDMLSVDGLGEKSCKRIYENIHNGLQNIRLHDLLGATCIFGYGIGSKRVEALLRDIPNLFKIYKTTKPDVLKQKVMKIDGFSEIMSEKIVNNVEYADLLIKAFKPYVTYKEEIRVSDDMVGKQYCFSGIRNKEMEEAIVSRGGKIVSGVSKKLTALIVKDTTATGKYTKAKELGIPIYLENEFQSKYLN